MEVFIQRLEQEYEAQPIVTAPSVTYKAKIFGSKNITKYQNEIITFNNPAHFPDMQIVSELYEPMIIATVITPGMYFLLIVNALKFISTLIVRRIQRLQKREIINSILHLIKDFNMAFLISIFILFLLSIV